MEMGKIVKSLRESRGWSKSDLAMKLDLKSYSTITKWESSENHPRGKEIRMLCELFNVSADYLLGLKSDTKAEHINYYKYFPTSVSAGLLNSIDAITEDQIQWIAMHDDVMGKFAGAPDVFFVNVSGTSMNKVIPENSMVAVKPLSSLINLKDGDIVIFSKDNEFSIKRFFNDIQHSRLIFRPESTDAYHTDIVISQNEYNSIKIYGKVILHIAKFNV